MTFPLIVTMIVLGVVTTILSLMAVVSFIDAKPEDRDYANFVVPALGLVGMIYVLVK
jgi:uncharacterized membrane protein